MAIDNEVPSGDIIISTHTNYIAISLQKKEEDNTIFKAENIIMSQTEKCKFLSDTFSHSKIAGSVTH